MIIDASVAVPWLVETPFSRPARQLRGRHAKAPALVLVETANSLLKYVRAGRLEQQDLHLAFKALPIALNELVADATLLSSALNIAFAQSHKIHDCLYVALAIQRREPLATADRRLATIARALDVETVLIEPA